MTVCDCVGTEIDMILAVFVENLGYSIKTAKIISDL